MVFHVKTNGNPTAGETEGGSEIRRISAIFFFVAKRSHPSVCSQMCNSDLAEPECPIFFRGFSPKLFVHALHGDNRTRRPKLSQANSVTVQRRKRTANRCSLKKKIFLACRRSCYLSW